MIAAAERCDRATSLRDLLEGLAGTGNRGVTFVDARFREERLTWAELAARADAFADAARRLGAREGHRVLLPMTSSATGVAAFLGLVAARCVPMTAHAVEPGAPGGTRARRRLDELTRRHAIPWRVDDVGALIRSGEGDAALEDARAESGRDALAFVQFSSGTTREPKGVELPHGAVLSNLAAAAELDVRDERAVHVTWLPLSHDMGLVGGLLASLPSAHELVLMDPACFALKPVSWLEALSRWRATSTAAPDFAYALACERVPEAQLRRRGLDLSALRAAYDGAEPVRPRTVRAFEERYGAHGLAPGTVRPVYGLAEATLLACAPASGESVSFRAIGGRELASVGRPVRGLALRVVDAAGRDREPLDEGEILLRGSSLLRSYHGDAELTRAALDGAWLRTGDVGTLDAEGRLFVTGRLKDVLIAAGRKHSGAEIGAVVDELPFVRRGHSHAVALPRRDGHGEEIVVLLSPSSAAARAVRRATDRVGESLAPLGPPGRAAASLIARLGALASATLRGAASRRHARLAERFAPLVRRHVAAVSGLAVDRVELVERLPKTTSGKVLREECLRIALARREAASTC